MHHPPLDIGVPAMDRIGLVDKLGFAEVVAGADHIRHIFFGHVHRPLSGAWRGIPYASLRSLVHQVPLDFVTETLEYFEHTPPAYNVILLDGEDTVVHHHEFLDASRVPPGTERYTKVG
jgi:3',5'-cyclic AMP phosphodiesterase CpdA